MILSLEIFIFPLSILLILYSFVFGILLINRYIVYFTCLVISSLRTLHCVFQLIKIIWVAGPKLAIPDRAFAA